MIIKEYIKFYIYIYISSPVLFITFKVFSDYFNNWLKLYYWILTDFLKYNRLIVNKCYFLILIETW